MLLRQALVALGPKTLVPIALVGSALIGLGALFIPHAQPGVYRYTLHAPEQLNAIYVSAWNEGDVYENHDAGDGKTVTFTRRADEHDGCRWQGTESLTPIAAHAYVYDYSEKILSCEPDAHPFVITPRRGIVTVERMDNNLAALTPLDDVQAPGDLWAAEDDVDSDDLTVEIEEAVNLAVDNAGDEGGCDSDDDENVATDSNDNDE